MARAGAFEAEAQAVVVRFSVSNKIKGWVS
jgi:hypothetical protein